MTYIGKTVDLSTEQKLMFKDGQMISVFRFRSETGIDHSLPNMALVTDHTTGTCAIAATDAMLAYPAKLLRAGAAHEVGHLECGHINDLYCDERRDPGLELEADAWAAGAVGAKNLVRLFEQTIKDMMSYYHTLPVEDPELAASIAEIMFRRDAINEVFRGGAKVTSQPQPLTPRKSKKGKKARRSQKRRGRR